MGESNVETILVFVCLYKCGICTMSENNSAQKINDMCFFFFFGTVAFIYVCINAFDRCGQIVAGV